GSAFIARPVEWVWREAALAFQCEMVRLGSGLSGGLLDSFLSAAGIAHSGIIPPGAGRDWIEAQAPRPPARSDSRLAFRRLGHRGPGVCASAGDCVSRFARLSRANAAGGSGVSKPVESASLVRSR